MLSLSPGCVINAPIICQNNVLLSEFYQAKDDTSSYYKKTSIDNMLLDYFKRSGGQSASGNKTFTGLTRLDGGMYTRRHIVSKTTTLGNFVLGSLMRFASGPPGYTVTIPSPSAHPGGRITLHLQQSGVNIPTPSGRDADADDRNAQCIPRVNF